MLTKQLMSVVTHFVHLKRNTQWTCFLLAAVQHGRPLSGAGLGQHPHGGGQAPRWRSSGGAAAHPLEEGGEPHH